MNKDEGAYKLDHIYDHMINQQKVTLSSSFTPSAVNHYKTPDQSEQDSWLELKYFLYEYQNFIGSVWEHNVFDQYLTSIAASPITFSVISLWEVK